ncbi:hypothetical protein ABLE93_15140 [Xanthobacter sp. KR7-65]|uniref:hypothetical protein n=1 Tax=Xanthobacter sp. KR7-65 TaxID=3156612 RepID=UPI0032B3B658
MTNLAPPDATAIAAVPATALPSGFRLLVLRELASGDGPAGYAVIGQSLLRAPPRTIRHGVAFALAFRPEAVDWLSGHLGRPAARGADGSTARNPRWPRLAWHRAERFWTDGSRTTEWSADILFENPVDSAAFAERFATALAGAAGP